MFPVIDSFDGPYKGNDYFARFWPAIYLGIINTSKVVGAAAIIKYVKYWWLKQKEKERMEREKMYAELKLLKAQIRPSFLFNTLNNIKENSINASSLGPETLIKLSDLLSYMLYESDKPAVSLDKEISMMKKYMEIEKIRLGESFEMGINIRGDLNGKMIAPFLLLPFIENSFKQSCALTGNSWITMDIGMEEEFFIMKLANGIIADANGTAEERSYDLTNVQKRLILIYPQHELKLYAAQEMLITHLKIPLDDITTTLRKENAEPVINSIK